MKSLIPFFLFTLIICTPTFSHTVTGTLVDAQTNRTLPQASILVQGTAIGAVSNADGTFTLEITATGNYTLVCTYLGYQTLVREVEITDGELNLGQLALQPAARDWGDVVVVTADRDGRKHFSTPESVSVLREKQIEQNGARSMAEALIGLPGVWMQKTNHGGGSPFVRGLTGNQTLLLLDGIRLNNSTYRYGPNQYFNTIDVLNVQQVEVVRGPGSVLYGSDALGGTVQVISKSPQFSAAGRQWSGTLYGKMISGDMEQSGRAEVEMSGEKAALRAGFSYRDFGDLIAGGDLGKQAPSAYGERAADFKSLFKTGQNSLLTLAYNGVFQSEVGRYDQVAQRGYELYQFNPQNRQLAYARWQLNAASPLLRALKLTASVQQSLEGREKRRAGSAELTTEEDEVQTLGLAAEWVAQPRANWRAVSGLEFYADRVGSFTTVRNLENGDVQTGRGLYPDDSRANNLAVFSSHTFQWEALSLNLGGRLNFFEINIQDAVFGDTRIDPTALVGNVSLHYKLAPQHALTAAVNTGFRAPNVNDLSSFGSFDFGIETPSQTLSPERSLTYELGYKTQTERWSGRLALFYTQLYDLIGRVRGTFQGMDTYQGEDVYRKENVARAYIQGVETDWQWALSDRWDLFGSVIYIYGQDTEKDEPMRRIPPLNGRLALSYHAAGGFFGQAEGWYAARQDRLSSGDLSDHRIDAGGTPGWLVLNFKAGYQWKWLQVNGGLQNLLDEAYRIHGSGVDGVGRSFWLGTKIRF